ncbi:MAG TPA: Holliday junction branch migration protein RuvA [Synergistales bacterium]|nr:Holliday junction branch migration protein RuvA [Synergistales bacterium]
MLRSLFGQVIQVEDETVVLDVNGLGIEVHCSRRALESCVEGEMTRIQTFLLVNESGISLFGFANDEERRLFLELLAVKGIGGRMAMSLLRAEPPGRLIRAILSSDLETLTRVPGVGKKTAERLCFELRERLAKSFPSFTRDGAEPASSPAGSEVLEALVGLGFSRHEAAAAVRTALSQADSGAREEEILESALRLLNRIRGEYR